MWVWTIKMLFEMWVDNGLKVIFSSYFNALDNISRTSSISVTSVSVLETVI